VEDAAAEGMRCQVTQHVGVYVQPLSAGDIPRQCLGDSAMCSAWILCLVLIVIREGFMSEAVHGLACLAGLKDVETCMVQDPSDILAGEAGAARRNSRRNCRPHPAGQPPALGPSKRSEQLIDKTSVFA